MERPTSRTTEAYRRLRDQITSGQLRAGSVVSEAALAKELGISRTPIGEALRRLSHDGLVEQVPRFGTIVREIPRQELQDLFEIREALEGVAARKAAERVTPEAIAELESLHARIDSIIRQVEAEGGTRLQEEPLQQFLAADMAFHMLIIAWAGNNRLASLVENTRAISSMFDARRGEHSLERVLRANRDHRKIILALTKRNGEQANKLVANHIRNSCRQSLEQSDTPAPVTLAALNLPDSVRRSLGDESEG